MKILITFIYLKGRTGGELFIYDLSLALLKMGHTPIIFTSKDKGPLYDEIERKGIPITTDLETIGTQPDIIMGNSQEEFILAWLYFANVPAVYMCHDRFAWYAIPPNLPRVYKYIAISKNVADGMIYNNKIKDARTIISPNSVDTNKFKLRSLPLPEKPQRALIFSNYATPNGHPKIIESVCENLNINLDKIGLHFGNVTNCPEKVLPNYDLVFARGRCALEALACGCSVILCDIEGAGSLITSNNVQTLWRNNFGWRLLQSQITTTTIMSEILKYNSKDAFKVSQYIQKEANLDSMANRTINLFQSVINEHGQQSKHCSEQQITNYIYNHLKQNSTYGTYNKLHETIHEQAIRQRQYEVERESTKLQHTQKVEALEKLVKLYEHDLIRYKQEIQQFYTSRSWRFTSPLRKLFCALRELGLH